MYLIVGLGNPEKQYEKTFHNMGYICAGDAAQILGAKFKKTECVRQFKPLCRKGLYQLGIC